MNPTLDILRQAVALWYEITGCPTERYGTFTLDSFHTQQEAEQVAELLRLDPTGVAAYTLLRAYFEERIKGLQISVYDLLVKRGAVEADILRYQRVRDTLEDPWMIGVIDDTYALLRQGIRHYGAEPDEGLLADKTAMAVLTRDAYLAVNKLRAHQFIQGKPAGEPLGLNPGVYEFWNIPSLVRAMQAQRMPGISVTKISLSACSSIATLVATSSMVRLKASPVGEKPNGDSSTMAPKSSILETLPSNSSPALTS